MKKDVYIEILDTPNYSIVELGRLGGQKAALRSYTGKEATYDARRFATLISEIIGCHLLETKVNSGFDKG